VQKRVLLSIKPEFAEKIFNGTKKYEFRRSMFKNDIKNVVVYASYPVKKAVGEFEVEEIISLNVNILWEITGKKSGIKREYFDQYFLGKTIGHAIEIGNPKLYSSPIDIEMEYKILKPPQSFMYLI
jgi:predicted transcriptional regulator